MDEQLMKLVDALSNASPDQLRSAAMMCQGAGMDFGVSADKRCIYRDLAKLINAHLTRC